MLIRLSSLIALCLQQLIELVDINHFVSQKLVSFVKATCQVFNSTYNFKITAQKVQIV